MVGLLGWVAWEAFTPHGLFTNPSEDGPQRADALGLVVTLFCAQITAVTGWLAVRQGWSAKRHGGKREYAPDHTPAELLPPLGDSGLAITTLRVHQAIELPEGAARATALDPELPSWVERTLTRTVRDWLVTSKEQGGFLLLAGDSAVGKTRLLYELGREILGDWPILAPVLGDCTPVRALASRASSLTGGVVVWLDELHRFLPGTVVTAGSTPLDPGVIGDLLNAPSPVVILGSLWPDHINASTATRTVSGGALSGFWRAVLAKRAAVHHGADSTCWTRRRRRRRSAVLCDIR
jgi:hypothetical protein